ncbi:MAG: endolytic transglycosylase MltG [Rhizobiaceae bacterium]|nr:endolytic transglycosylase MltG [Rhizobiaceae bacterium]
MNLSDDNSNNESRRPIIPVSPTQALTPQKAPQPPKRVRSKRARSQTVIFLNFLMTSLFLATLAAGGALYLGKILFEREGPLKQNTSFVVRDGASLGSIANDLESAGLVTDSRIFRHASNVLLDGDSLKAGEYEIKAGSSMRDIMVLLQSGKSILYSFTAPEGLTVFQIFERLRNDEDLTGDLPEELPPEGSLLPNTYKYSRGTTRQEIVDQMIAAQTRAVDRLWARRVDNLPIETKEEMVILASIVEKETGQADERPLVAGVFINRLNKGMRLQSDPTIIYGIFGGEGKPSGRPIYQSDLDKKTEYNTYQIDRLPPTPIANPGLQAMEAVINPSRTEDLFFVADGTGGHAFAKTLAEHNANVAAWRKIEAERRKAAESNSSSN